MIYLKNFLDVQGDLLGDILLKLNETPHFKTLFLQKKQWSKPNKIFTRKKINIFKNINN